MKLLSSIPLNNLTDFILSIDDYDFSASTLVTDASETFQCVLKNYAEENTETTHLVFGVEEGEESVVTLVAPGISSVPYEVTAKNMVIPILTETAGILFGGHPKPRPPKIVE